MIECANKISNQYFAVPENDDLSTFVGQRESVELLKVSCDASKERHSVMRHVLITGESGYGKTHLSYAVANEIGTGVQLLNFRNDKWSESELVAILTNMHDGDIVIAEQIQCLKGPVLEALEQAMNDYTAHITIGKGITATSMVLDLPIFTLIGITDNRRSLKESLLDEFEYKIRMKDYSADELSEIVGRAAYKQNIRCDFESLQLIGEAANGNPREALRLFKRVYDYVVVNHEDVVSGSRTKKVLDLLKFHSFY